jgi:hypothetical protein
VPTREQVRELLDSGMDYEAAGRRLGIPAGQAYLIVTGVPADGSDTIPDGAGPDGVREASRYLLPSSQRLSNPPERNPVSKDSVRRWMAARAAADGQMQAAKRQRAQAAG